jgi:hypothetical protein
VGSIPLVQRSPMKVTYSASVWVASTPVRGVLHLCDPGGRGLVRRMRPFYTFPPSRFRIVPANPCPPHRATRSMDLLNVRCQGHPSGGRFGLTPRPPASRTGTTRSRASRPETAARSCSTPVAPSLVHQGHSFTLSDLPPAWCTSCGCLRESGWGETSLSYRPKEKSSRWWSVSPHLSEQGRSREARCLPGRMSQRSTTIVVGPISLASKAVRT